jgi:predicted transcriptional regulator
LHRLHVMFGLLVGAAALLVSTSGYGQDTKKDAQTPAGKVQMPTGWTKLGIVGDQKKKILDVVAAYQGKIAALKDQMDKLKSEEYTEAFKLLNDDQKAMLKTIAAQKADPTIKDDKKVDDKKKGGY